MKYHPPKKKRETLDFPTIKSDLERLSKEYEKFKRLYTMDIPVGELLEEGEDLNLTYHQLELRLRKKREEWYQGFKQLGESLKSEDGKKAWQKMAKGIEPLVKESDKKLDKVITTALEMRGAEITAEIERAKRKRKGFQELMEYAENM